MSLDMPLIKRPAARNSTKQNVKLALKSILLGLFSLVMISTVGRCSISIMPMELQLKMPVTGSRLTGDIEVRNGGEAPIHVTSSLMDWTMTETGEPQFFEPGTQARSCAPQIQLNPTAFAVAPGQSVWVRYSISPNEISEEHWAMIFFQTRAMPMKSSGIGFNISTRVGCKVFITPNQTLPGQIKITDMEVQPISPSEIKAKAITAARAREKADKAKTTRTSTTDDEQVMPATEPQPAALPDLTTKVKVVLENTGLANIRLQCTLEARGEDGQVWARSVLPARTQVLSGKKREFWANLDKPLRPGTYLIKAIVDYGVKELLSGELKATVTTPVIAPLIQSTPIATVSAGVTSTTPVASPTANSTGNKNTTDIALVQDAGQVRTTPAAQ